MRARSLKTVRFGAIASSTSKYGKYGKAVLDDNPLAYWDFQEDNPTTTLADKSPNNRPMTSVSGLTPWPGGPVASPAFRSILFTTGSIAQRPVFNSSTDNMAVEFWHYGVSYQQDATFYYNQGSFGLVNQSNGRCYMQHASYANGTAINPGIQLNQWNHIVTARVSGVWTYYVNGSAVSSFNAAFPMNGSSGSFYVGNGQSGYYAHVAYYAPALSAGRIAAHYAARLA